MREKLEFCYMNEACERNKYTIASFTHMAASTTKLHFIS